MLIQRFTDYVLSGRRQAGVMALVWTIVPLMGWLGIVIVALVTLRKGVLEGFLVLIWTVLPSAVFAFMGKPMPFVYGVLCGSLVTWLLAVVLRETASWSFVLQSGILLGVVGVLLTHAAIHDINAYWYQLLKNYYTDAEKLFGLELTAAKMELMLQRMSHIATGAQAAALLFMNLANLVVARWLQALRFNPGGFAKEFINLRLGIIADVALVVIVAATLMKVTLAWDLLPLILLMFFVAGLSLLHAIVTSVKGTMWIWLLIFYALLVLFFIYIAPLVIAAAIVDSVLDFRQRYLANSI